MNDREMLTLAYGALLAIASDSSKMDQVIQIISNHLFPQSENEETDAG